MRRTWNLAFGVLRERTAVANHHVRKVQQGEYVRFCYLYQNTQRLNYTGRPDKMTPRMDDDDLENQDMLTPVQCPALKYVEDSHQESESQTGRLSKFLMKLPSDTSVIPALKELLEVNKPVAKNKFIVALSILKRNRRFMQAWEVADYMWNEGLFQMDAVDHMYRLYLTAQVGPVEDVEQCFRSIPSEHLTEVVYNQLISFYIGKGMLQSAENVLKKLKDSGQPVSTLPYNQFMSFYRHQRDPKKALELIEDMHASNVLPDTRTYNILLSTISKQGDPDGVLKNYKAMKGAGIASNILTLSLVAKAYLSVGMVGEAEYLASEMMKLKGKNRHLAHDLLLTVYAEQGKVEELKKVWKHLQRFNDLSARSYGIMIECLGKLGLIKEAERLATKSEKQKRKLPARVYNALMDVYGRHGMVEKAEDLMMRIKKTPSGANCVTYKHLIACYLKTDQLDKALEYLKLSKQSLKYDNSKPWFESFLLLLENLAQRGESDVAEQAFKYFTSPRSYRNVVAYNALIKSYVTAGKMPPNILQRMSADGVKPDAKTMSLLAVLESVAKCCT